MLPGSTLYPSSCGRKGPAEQRVPDRSRTLAWSQDKGLVSLCSMLRSQVFWKILFYQIPSAKDKVWGPRGKRGVLASEGQFLEWFLPKVILAHIATTFAEAMLTGTASHAQFLLLFLTSTVCFFSKLQEAQSFVILVLGKGPACWQLPCPGKRPSPLGSVTCCRTGWDVTAGWLCPARESPTCLLSVCPAGAEHHSLTFLCWTVPGEQQKAAPTFLHPTSACEQAPGFPWWARSDSWLPSGALCLCDCPMHPGASARVRVHPARLFQEARSSVRWCGPPLPAHNSLGQSGVSSVIGTA